MICSHACSSDARQPYLVSQSAESYSVLSNVSQINSMSSTTQDPILRVGVLCCLT